MSRKHYECFVCGRKFKSDVFVRKCSYCGRLFCFYCWNEYTIEVEPTTVKSVIGVIKYICKFCIEKLLLSSSVKKTAPKIEEEKLEDMLKKSLLICKFCNKHMKQLDSHTYYCDCEGYQKHMKNLRLVVGVKYDRKI